MSKAMKRIAAAGLLALAALPAAAQQYVFPSRGQSFEQQQRDEQYCSNWAVQQSGFNPMYAQAAPSGTPQPEPGSGARGALGGAALGAIIGDSSHDAGVGAVVGLIGGRMLSRMRQSDQQQQQQAAQAGARQNYNRARATCLMGLGYTVN